MPHVKVEFAYIEDSEDGSEREREAEMWVPLSLSKSTVEEDLITTGGIVTGKTSRRVGPWASNKVPFEGELDDAEINRLKSRNHPVHGHWQFTVTPLGGKS